MWLGTQERGKVIVLAALGLISAVLVYRGFFLPQGESEPARPPAADSRAAAPGSPEQGTPAGRPAARSTSGREKTMSQEQLEALDPTLRLDLVEKSRQIVYAGESRNIFQVYTPPPPSMPVVAPVVAPAAPAPPQSPVAPPMSARIPLKFYGTASRPGTSEKKAFLTDGEEIYIGEEGQLVAKYYKIIRIGVSAVELEDSRNSRRQSLPLLTE